MKFDNIIIGGGLSGLMAGIGSLRGGKKTAIITTGQSALHFWSGSFEFLCHHNGHPVINSPLEVAETLPDDHPYKKIGLSRVEQILKWVPVLLDDAGIKVSGSLEKNHYRMTPMGLLKPAWLTMNDYLSFSHPSDFKGQSFAVVNIAGYLDFYPRFICAGLDRLGVKCAIHTVDIPEIAELRKSTTEMRATNMSRVIDTGNVDFLASKINEVSRSADAVVMPAVLGIFSDAPVERLRQYVDRPVHFIATTPASVPGVRCQLALRDYFLKLGGAFFPGDTVTNGDIEGNRLRRIFTLNFENMPLEADNFVISTGSFFGHGLIATLDKIYEPILGLDLNVAGGRTEWYDKDFYAPQPYMEYGVVTDEEFHPFKDGKPIENLYATGALLAGFNALRQGSGAGITLLSALHAVSRIV